MEIDYKFCCGLNEINGVGNYQGKAKLALEEILNSVFYEYDRVRTAFLVFTEVRKKGNTYGADLARLIEKEKLGRVMQTNTKLNTNSGNKLRAYIWEINFNNARKYHANISTRTKL